MSGLPKEIEEKILCRLPAKSLLRCRSVCKSWNSLIADPSFISLHRRHSLSFLLFHLHQQQEQHPFNPLLLCSLSHPDTLSEYPLPLPSDSINAISHCHGLLCLSRNEKCSSFIICNPSLRRSLSLPKPRLYHDVYKANFAFGFDSRNRDYKIVRLVSTFGGYSRAALAVEVYSLASGTWRTLAPDAAPICTIDGARITWNAPYGFVNGLVHWGASRISGDRNSSFVLSFDFVDEVFGEVVLPERLSGIVSVVGGSDQKPLTVCRYGSGDNSPCSTSIWVMEECGEVKSWNKLFSLDITGSHLDAPFFGLKITGLTGSPPMALCVTNNGEVLVLTEEEEGQKQGLYLLDVKKGRFVDLLQHGGLGQEWWHIYAEYYSESLVLLNIDGMVSY